ncbi:MMPL family transporter [Streptomyces sp. NBC_01142]|uniref:MMPL family transporter n=1 Tax=Streptomyces sp. NBC_01142 TaxID=2975865 RepID=UPI00224CC5D2|nr:MMPL family transporter [Streptomyces sp. NBC_01142]MCX4819018.1 MMPL family transporter [Streptomyces sp. NBC_01142]
MASQRNLAASLGGWSARHRKTAVFGWLFAVIALTVLGGMAGQQNLTEADYGTGESGRAARILVDADIRTPAPEMVLVHSDELTADKPEFKKAVADAVAAVDGTGLAEKIGDPYKTGAVSKDQHDALIQFAVKGDPDTAADRIKPVIDAIAKTDAAHASVTLGEYGAASGLKGINDSLGKDFTRAEFTAVPVALGILLVVFGALLAAVLPLILAITACVAAMGLLALSSQLVPVDAMTNSVMLLMGLAVGVDYCLFYIRREREERAAGRDKETALRIAAATSGRSVLISGITVAVAMAGMFFSGLTVFEGFAIATIEVVLIAVLGSMTVLPAVMAMLGDKVELGRIPGFRRKARVRHANERPGKLLGAVLKVPSLFALIGIAALLALAAPALSMKTEKLGFDQLLPADNPMVTTAQRIEKAFPGAPAPAQIVYKASSIGSPAATQAIEDFKKQALASKQVMNPIEVTVHKGENIAVISAPLAGDGRGATSVKALETLREDIIPATLTKAAGSDAPVGGDLAFSTDYNDQLKSSIVPVFAFVMGVSFLLMLLCFRSIVIAITAIILNLLSVAAAYGVMTAVFQKGWGDELVGTTAVGAIESWMPLFVFVVLFGLSMDYHVFVVSRIREAHDRGADNIKAVAHGIRSTAGVVTSAGMIMVAVFAVFGTLSMQDFKQLGIGLAVAVFLDATLVRAVLLPAVMALLGKSNWYLPRWLKWLPELSHGEEEAAEAPERTSQTASAHRTPLVNH